MMFILQSCSVCLEDLFDTPNLTFLPVSVRNKALSGTSSMCIGIIFTQDT